jgi:hypothetical protein
MPVAVTFTALGIFLVVMVALAVHHVLQWQQLQRIRMQPAGRPFSSICVAHAFEPSHAMLWDSQVPALEVIGSGGAKGVPIQRLFAAFCETAQLYPELYDGTNFEQWLEFLQNSRLIARNDYRVALTAEGQEFLHYLVTLARLIAA